MRWFLVALLLLASCPAKRGGSEGGPSKKLSIYKIEAFERSAPTDKVPGITPAMLGGWMRERLQPSSVVALISERKEGAYRLQLELGVATRSDPSGKIERVILASGHARVADGIEGIDLEASKVTPFPPQGTEEKERSYVRKVVDAVIEDVLYQAELVVSEEPRLIKALSERDVHRLGVAVEIAALRKARQAVPALITLLHHPEASISDRAIGALVAIGDRRAVPALTRLTEFRNTAQLAKLLDAIGALGGREARDYLEFVASGHEDADIRSMATEALERLKRKEGSDGEKK